jgi:hypothetical protein
MIKSSFNTEYELAFSNISANNVTGGIGDQLKLNSEVVELKFTGNLKNVSKIELFADEYCIVDKIAEKENQKSMEIIVQFSLPKEEKEHKVYIVLFFKNGTEIANLVRQNLKGMTNGTEEKNEKTVYT